MAKEEHIVQVEWTVRCGVASRRGEGADGAAAWRAAGRAVVDVAQGAVDALAGERIAALPPVILAVGTEAAAIFPGLTEQGRLDRQATLATVSLLAVAAR